MVCQQVCAHGGEVIPGPDSRDSIGGPTTVPAVSKFISNTLRGVATQPSITEYCMYTVRFSPYYDHYVHVSPFCVKCVYTIHIYCIKQDTFV